MDKNIYIEELYRLYEQKVYRIAHSILNNVGQAEDVTQEVFITMYYDIDIIGEAESIDVKRQIFKITKNKAIDIYRKNQRESSLMETASQEYQATTNEKSTHEINQILNHQVLQEAIRELPSKYKEVIMYRTYYDMTSKETATIMKITEATVRKRYERAKEMLAKLLGGDSL
jgi:RNA polymerase sigma-70 factor (ECF subfamily)